MPAGGDNRARPGRHHQRQLAGGAVIYAAVTAGDLMTLQARIQALESGASGGMLVDETGATLVDDAGNNLIMENI